MKLIYILPFLFFACEQGNNTPVFEEPDELTAIELSAYKRMIEEESIEVLMQERWNETLVRPEVSRIENFKYSTNDLFQTWTWSSGGLVDSAFSINKNAFRPNEEEYKYTIHNDSIRIFTQYEYGDGIERGIITKLTQDSLVINFSDGGTAKYIHFKK
jgi:hypothetical protein